MGTIQQANSRATWRARLRRASFAGAVFHVEQQSRASGMRAVVHEYPKRNDPYTEIMGRQAVRYQVTGYCIGPDYQLEKDQLVAVLERPEAGLLVDPYMPTKPLMVVCERFSVTETRERGGYCTFEMSFVELGKAANSFSSLATNTALALSNQAIVTGTASSNTLNNAAVQYVSETGQPSP